MGYALAEAARRMGSRVTLISGPTSLTPPVGVELVSIETTQQLFEAVSERFSDCDCLIMAVAPAMNPGMWSNKVTQRNLNFLQDEMGYALAEAARRMGSRVTLISGPTTRLPNHRERK